MLDRTRTMRAEAKTRPGVTAEQPLPRITEVVRLRIGNVWVSAITRRWRHGDVPRCRLCPVCTAYKGSCTLLVTRSLTASRARLFSIVGLMLSGPGAWKGQLKVYRVGDEADGRS